MLIFMKEKSVVISIKLSHIGIQIPQKYHHLEAGCKITLFSKLRHTKYIAQIKILI